jgi:hypothetical protein
MTVMMVGADQSLRRTPDLCACVWVAGGREAASEWRVAYLAVLE